MNDNTPDFSSSTYAAQIDENSVVGISIVTVNATDRDLGANGRVRYTLHPEAQRLFRINEMTGEIVSKAVFDHESNAEVRFRVIATDSGSPPLSNTATVILQINDVNDAAPVFSEPSGYTFGVREDEPSGTQVGRVSAHDADGASYNQVTYSLTPTHSAHNVFEIDETSGRIITTVKLDREVNPVYYLLVEARDNGSPAAHSSTSTVSVYVTDINDHSPEFDFPSRLNNTVHVSSHTPKGHPIAKLSAHDLDIGINGNVTYKASNARHLFMVDARTGLVTVNEDLSSIDYETFTLDIIASDHGEPVESTAASLNIIVNRSIPFTYAHSAILAGHNFTIVVSLGCLTGVIVVILIIAIALIKRQDTDKKGRNYNCRMQALKALHTNTNGVNDHDEETGVPEPPPIRDCMNGSTAGGLKTNGSCIYDKPSSLSSAEKPVKEVSFNLDHENNPVQDYSCMVSIIDYKFDCKNNYYKKYKNYTSNNQYSNIIYHNRSFSSQSSIIV